MRLTLHPFSTYKDNMKELHPEDKAILIGICFLTGSVTFLISLAIIANVFLKAFEVYK